MVLSMADSKAPTGPNTEDGEPLYPFGFKRVSAEEKSTLVRSVFNSVAPKYDLMNDLMSGGVHRLWKSAMVNWLAPQPNRTYLDVAGGTGDIAFRILERLRPSAGKTLPQMYVCDITDGMLKVGRERAASYPSYVPSLNWICGNAEQLPLGAHATDVYTIAFGIRNVTDVARALSEAYRVLKPGGRFLCLEFSTVIVPGLDDLYERYSFNVLPRLGEAVADDRESYQYLVESIRRFPDQETFASMIETAGFANVQVRNLSGGIAALHSAWRI